MKLAVLVLHTKASINCTKICLQLISIICFAAVLNPQLDTGRRQFRNNKHSPPFLRFIPDFLSAHDDYPRGLSFLSHPSSICLASHLSAHCQINLPGEGSLRDFKMSSKRSPSVYTVLQFKGEKKFKEFEELVKDEERRLFGDNLRA